MQGRSSRLRLDTHAVHQWLLSKDCRRRLINRHSNCLTSFSPIANLSCGFGAAAFCATAVPSITIVGGLAIPLILTSWSPGVRIFNGSERRLRRADHKLTRTPDSPNGSGPTAKRDRGAIIAAQGLSVMKWRQGYKGYVIEARSCELSVMRTKARRILGAVSIEEHDADSTCGTETAQKPRS